MNTLENNVFDYDPDLNFDFDLDFDPESFLDEDYQESGPVEINPQEKSQFARVKRFKRPRLVAYEYAEALADDVGMIDEDETIYAILSGNFIAGDFIEAYLVRHNLFADELLIATLSMSKANVDSLKNLQTGGFVASLDLLVSDYFFSHERRNITEYLIQELATDNFRFAAAGLHTKITLIKTEERYLVLTGSANLRSSGNLEQLTILNNKAIFEFNKRWMCDLMETYQVDHERLRGNKLWLQVQKSKI
jgi:hypothetical protein